MFANYHTHTTRCGHAQDSEREYIETGIARGLKILGFSDHAPYSFPHGYAAKGRVLESQIEEYYRTLSDLRAEYKKDIEILIGFEAEYYPDLFGNLLRAMEPYDFQYLLMGQHYIYNEYDHPIHNFSPCEDPASLIQYVSQVLEGLQTGKFTYLAHPDMKIFTGDEEIYRREMRRLCEGVKKLGLPLEINGLGMGEGRSYPSDRFFSIAGEVGNVVVIGNDAHKADKVAREDVYQKCRQMAEKYHLQVLDTVPLRGPHSEKIIGDEAIK